jgi:hypothetical protein
VAPTVIFVKKIPEGEIPIGSRILIPIKEDIKNGRIPV